LCAEAAFLVHVALQLPYYTEICFYAIDMIEEN